MNWESFKFAAIGAAQTVWNINASTANKLRFIWAKAPIELDGAVWFGIFI